MNATQSAAFLALLYTRPSPSESKAIIIAICQAAGFDVTSYVDGDPTAEWLDVMGRAMSDFSAIPEQASRGAFFALATDPGDVDDFGVPDQSADQTPRAGFLSALGIGLTGTTRGEQKRATSFVTLRNDGAIATIPFLPGALTLEQTTPSPARVTDGGRPSYTTTADPAIYTGIGGTLPPLAPGASVTLPVLAVQVGVYGSANLNQIDHCITQSYGTLTVTGSTTAIGQEREARPAYIARCLRAMDRLSPGGPVGGYLYAMNTAKDGTPLQRFDGTGDVTITQAYVSPASALCEVTIYYGGPAGAVDDIDVSSANANTEGIPLGVITDPLGVLPGCVAILPLANDPNLLPAGTPGGASCINTAIPINYAVRIASENAGQATPGAYVTPWRASARYEVGQKVSNASKTYTCTVAGTSAASGGPTVGSGTTADGTVTWLFVSTGGAPPSAVLALMTAIAAACGAYTLSAGIGGVEQTAGVGSIFTSDIADAAQGAATGLYAASLTLPSGGSTVIALGHIGRAGSGTTQTITGTITVV